MTNALQILKQYWNYDSFRSPQDNIIEAVTNKKQVIALLPTGGGKSICFQVPALLSDGVCIVVSPLIALMQDQVDSLNEKGIKAMALTSGIDQDELITLFDNIRFGNYKFLYLSPERLQSVFIQEKIKQLNVNLIAIDEAHCISEWGHDFRPSYRNIKVLKTLKPNIPIIALTATATKKVIDDISSSLELESPTIFKKSFYRENLAYQFFNIEDKLQRLLQICTKTKSPIIIYVSSRNKTKEIANFLNAQGFNASYYHGGLPATNKQIAFDQWISEQTPIMVATNAFGMGIDKSNVRVVVHLDLPNSIENYIQEAGRAGRDGKKAFSAVLYNSNDIRIFEEKFKQAFPSIHEIKSIYKSLFQKYRIALGELVETGFEFNLLEFSNAYKYTPAKVDSTLRLLHNNGIVEVSNNYNKKSTLQFTATSRQVLLYVKAENITSKLIQLLLRSYGGIFEQETNINEFWIAQKLGIFSSKVVEVLSQLDSESIVSYKKATKNGQLFFLLPREDDKTINRISKNISAYIQQKIQKSQDLLQLTNNNQVCRSRQILIYFNEAANSNCGMCDVCLNAKERYTNISKEITSYLSKKEFASSQEICSNINSSEKNVLVNLQLLLAEEKIAINNYNQYYINS